MSELIEDEYHTALCEMRNKIMKAVQDSEQNSFDNASKEYNRRRLEKRIYEILERHTSRGGE